MDYFNAQKSLDPFLITIDDALIYYMKSDFIFRLDYFNVEIYGSISNYY